MPELAKSSGNSNIDALREEANQLPPAERMVEIHALEGRLCATTAQHNVLDLCMAVATSTDFSRGEKPVWLMLAGGSGSGKTYTAKLLGDLEHTLIELRGKVTAAGFHSGYNKRKTNEAVKGLLNELDNKCLILYELGKALSGSANDVKALIGTLADCFDGETRDQFGTQDYQGTILAHFSMIA